jgi:flagellar hook-associated protein 2
MATGILGLGSSGAAGLNQELIDKLKDAEYEARVKPYETDLEEWDAELEKITEIEGKVTEFLTSVKGFDLFSSSANAFEQVAASTTGTSAVFDAADVSGLTPGTNYINITQLAQRDVYQTNAVDEATKDTALGAGTLSISIGGAAATDFDTTGKTYDELADEIDAVEGLTASIEQVGEDSYRLVIKSTDSGLANALTITETGIDFGINDSDGDTIPDEGNHTLTAQNMNATVDGIEYDVSSNTITIQGNLTMTAVEEGESTISIQRDTASLLPAVEEMVGFYNELVDLVDGELYSSESPIENTSTLRSMMTQIKEILFDSYGSSDELNAFNFGFELDKSGHLSVDSAKFAEAIAENYDDLERLFVGVAEDEGLGTRLKEYLDDLDSYDGLMTLYGDDMADRKVDLVRDLKSILTTWIPMTGL